MPCYEVNTISVEFSPQHYGVLMKAVESLGGKMRRGNGQATVVIGDQTVIVKDGKANGPEQLVNSLRVAYSTAIVDQAKQWAAAKGWQTTASGGKTTITGRR